MSCLCHYGPALLRFWFQTYLGHENSASYLKIQAGKTFSYHGHALVTLYVQFLCSDWSKFDRWVHAENLCSILKLVYFDSWSWQSFVSTCDVFNTGCAKWNTAAIKSLLLFMAGLFICINNKTANRKATWGLLGYWSKNASLIKVGNPISDSTVFVFHLMRRLWLLGSKVQRTVEFSFFHGAGFDRILGNDKGAGVTIFTNRKIKTTKKWNTPEWPWVKGQNRI